MSNETTAVDTPAADRLAAAPKLFDAIDHDNRNVRRAIVAAVLALVVIVLVVALSGGSGASVAAFCSAGRNATALNSLFSGATETAALDRQGTVELHHLIAIAPSQVTVQVRDDMQLMATGLDEFAHGESPSMSQSQFEAAAVGVQSWSQQNCPSNAQ